MNCRMCGSSNLYKFLDLGFTPPADQFRRKDQIKEPDIYYPLDVHMCDDCGLVQLGYVVSPEVLYRNDYPYESSTTQTGHRHWEGFSKSVVNKFKLTQEDLVVDIGSNVGVLLSEFKKNNVRVQGVDPAANIVMLARERGINTICDFFNSETVEQICNEMGLASVITATNVFAHVHDLDGFMMNVKKLLNEEGIFIFEAPYFRNLLSENEYDTIYHEHLSYLSVKPLIPFFGKFDLEVFDIEQMDIHGGSFRVFVGKKSARLVSARVGKMLEEEQSLGMYDHDTLDQFSNRVAANKRELTWLLHSLKNKGKRIAGVSAPAKGMTLLNYCGIDRSILDFVTEKSTLKIGRYTPGAHIPVVPDTDLFVYKPDYVLLLAWNFADEIMKNLKSYHDDGGKFIIPIPAPRIVG